MTKATCRRAGFFGLSVPGGQKSISSGERHSSKVWPWRQKQEVESSHLDLMHEAESRVAFDLKAWSQFFSSMAVSPNHPQTVTSTGDQGFQFLRLWGTFLTQTTTGRCFLLCWAPREDSVLAAAGVSAARSSMFLCPHSLLWADLC